MSFSVWRLHFRPICFQLARLPSDDMSAVYNMKYLEQASDTKKSSIGAFSLKFDVHKVYVCFCCMKTEVLHFCKF